MAETYLDGNTLQEKLAVFQVPALTYTGPDGKQREALGVVLDDAALGAVPAYYAPPPSYRDSAGNLLEPRAIYVLGGNDESYHDSDGNTLAPLVLAIEAVDPPDPPLVGPLDKPVANLSGHSFNFTFEFTACIVRVVATKTTSGASGLAVTIGGTPMVLDEIADQGVTGGVVTAIFSLKGITPGVRAVAVSGNVSVATVRMGEVVDFTAARQTDSAVPVSQYYWEAVLTGVLPTSNVTLAAGSTLADSWEITSDPGIREQWSTIYTVGNDNVVAFYGQEPVPHGDNYYVVYPALYTTGAIAAVEYTLLKPILPDLQPPVPIIQATVTRLPNGNYQCTVYPGSSARFLWPEGQLQGGRSYNLSFTCVSLTGDAASAAYWDWCDGIEGGAGTVPSTQQPLTVGAVSATVSRPAYTSTFRFLDISNDLDPDEDWGVVVAVITPPVLRALA